MPSSTAPLRNRITALRLVCAAALCISLAVAVIACRHWPLFGDAALMNYVVFLLHKGLVPYKNIADINLPGTYLFQAVSMRLFGDGALGSRLYDFVLLAATLAAALTLAGRKRWFAGLFAGCLFALIHLQDGIPQTAQRDLLLAALLLWAYVPLFAVLRDSHHNRRTIFFALLFGLAFGVTFTIKPVLVPLAAALLLLLAVSQHRQRRPIAAPVAVAVLAMAIPGAIMLLWLKTAGAWPAFFARTLPLLRLHTRLGDRSVPYLLAHCVSPIGFLCLLWIALQLAARPSFNTERIALWLGILGAILAYVLQGKGYPYQRYPLLAVLLLLIALDVDHALRHILPNQRLASTLAIVTAIFACLVLAPRMAWLTTTYSPTDPFEAALSQQLTALTPQISLPGNIQCIDTFGGCIQTLDALRLSPSTGFLYDCYLFTVPSAERDRYRAAFWAALQTAKPKIIVVSNEDCFQGKRGFEKLARWPLLAADLSLHYREQTEWHSPTMIYFWKRREDPFAFRIYLRNPK